jgi:Putative bacterial sensory transduction regulator
MKTAKVLSEDDLTPEKLKKFFEGLYMKTELTERDHLIVHVDNGSSVFITLDRRRKLLKFGIAYNNEIFQLGIANTNRINNSYILGRFSISEQGDSIIVDYCLPYDGGVSPYQLLSVLRILTSVVNEAIGEEISRIQQEASNHIVPEHTLN